MGATTERDRVIADRAEPERKDVRSPRSGGRTTRHQGAKSDPVDSQSVRVAGVARLNDRTHPAQLSRHHNGNQAESFQLTIVTEVPTCALPVSEMSLKITWAVRSMSDVGQPTIGAEHAWNSTARPPGGATMPSRAGLMMHST